MTASLVDGSRPAPAPSALAETAASASARPSAARPARAPRDTDSLPAEAATATDAAPDLSEAQLAEAATADSGQGDGAGSGSGSGGGACNMARWLQGALRKDALVQAAVADARRAPGSAARAMMVWNGDWLRSSGQDGKGLAAVREAIIWEIAFAPEACRAQPVHGLVLFSLDDAPGAARLVVGSASWRWSDLLH